MQVLHYGRNIQRAFTREIRDAEATSYIQGVQAYISLPGDPACQFKRGILGLYEPLRIILLRAAEYVQAAEFQIHGFELI